MFFHHLKWWNTLLVYCSYWEADTSPPHTVKSISNILLELIMSLPVPPFLPLYLPSFLYLCISMLQIINPNLSFTYDDVGMVIQMFSFRYDSWGNVTLTDFDGLRGVHKCRCVTIVLFWNKFRYSQWIEKFFHVNLFNFLVNSILSASPLTFFLNYLFYLFFN